mgnify:CR=1 FL=1
MRIKLSRKESKDSKLFLRLLDTCRDADLEAERAQLVQEAQS